jgi:hypothetical protein
MTCAECERLRTQYLLVRETAFELVDHRNASIWRYDPDPAWQLDLLIMFIAEMRGVVGAAFLKHREAHRVKELRHPCARF